MFRLIMAFIAASLIVAILFFQKIEFKEKKVEQLNKQNIEEIAININQEIKELQSIYKQKILFFGDKDKAIQSFEKYIKKENKNWKYNKERDIFYHKAIGLESFFTICEKVNKTKPLKNTKKMENKGCYIEGINTYIMYFKT